MTSYTSGGSEVLFEWQLNHSEPFSLIHGDYRLDNLMLHPAGRDVVVVDWQTLMTALPSRDLGYFIGTSLPAEQRREQEGQLVGEVLRDVAIPRCHGLHVRTLFDRLSNRVASRTHDHGDRVLDVGWSS